MDKPHINQAQKPKLKSVDDSIPPTDVQTLHHPADTNICAANVVVEDTQLMNVTEKRGLLRSLQPKYLHHNIWREHSFSLTTAEWSETALPLPHPPVTELNNHVTSNTIQKHPSLFHVSTPINIKRFQSMLHNHPNQPFVKSVCEGLRDGFWPWADTVRGQSFAAHARL